MYVTAGSRAGRGRELSVGAVVFSSATQTTNNATGLQLSFSTVRFDNATCWNAALPKRLYAPIGGLYSLWSYAVWASNAAGLRYLTFRINGSAYIDVTDNKIPLNGDSTRQTINGMWPLNGGDYIEVEAFQTSGGNLNVTPAEMGLALITRGPGV